MGEEVRVKKLKASALTSMPSIVGLCGGRTSKLFPHWSASFSLPPPELPPPPRLSSSSWFSIRSSIMLESAVSRNQAADPPQLLQEDPAPAPLHHRFYGTPSQPMVTTANPLTLSKMKLLLVLLALAIC